MVEKDKRQCQLEQIKGSYHETFNGAIVRIHQQRAKSADLSCPIPSIRAVHQHTGALHSHSLVLQKHS